MKWRLNKIQYPVHNLGQGKRIGIWVQGCTLACKGCVNRDISDACGGKELDLRFVFNGLLLKSEAFDGITITGGEPFQQYEQLIAFLHLVKTRTRLNVLCYTGYYLHELYAMYPDKLFATYIDILIDGRYVEKFNGDDASRGSSNQSVYRFEKGIPFIDNDYTHKATWSLHVDAQNTVYLSGIPAKGQLEQLRFDLETSGIEKTFS